MEALNTCTENNTSKRHGEFRDNIIKSTLTFFKSEIQNLENQINELKQQQNGKDSDLVTDLTELIIQLTEKEKQFENCNEHKLDTLKKENESQQKQINDKDAKIKELQIELAQQKEINLENQTVRIAQDDNIKSLTHKIRQFQVFGEFQKELTVLHKNNLISELTEIPELTELTGLTAKEKEISELTEWVTELQNELKIKKTLNVQNEKEINELKTQIQLLTNQMSEKSVNDINHMKESGAIDIVMICDMYIKAEQERENRISKLTQQIDVLEKKLQKEKAMNEQYKNEISMRENKNNKLKGEVQRAVESKLKSMKRFCKALEQLRNAVKLLQKENGKQQIQIEKHGYILCK